MTDKICQSCSNKGKIHIFKKYKKPFNSEEFLKAAKAVQEGESSWEKDLLSLIHGYIYSKTWGGGNVFDESKDWQKIKSFISTLLQEQKADLIKRLEHIKEESDYQEYGWAELERDLTKLIKELNQDK